MFADFAFFQFVIERDVSSGYVHGEILAVMSVDEICNLSSKRLGAREFDAMHERVRDVRKTKIACSTPGSVRRDLTPGGKVRTAGLPHPVVKEKHTCEFASFPIARFPLL